MVKRTGRYGSFWGGSRYPGCQGTQPFKIDHEGQPCRHCGTPVVRRGPYQAAEARRKLLRLVVQVSSLQGCLPRGSSQAVL